MQGLNLKVLKGVTIRQLRLLWNIRKHIMVFWKTSFFSEITNGFSLGGVPKFHFLLQWQLLKIKRVFKGVEIFLISGSPKKRLYPLKFCSNESFLLLTYNESFQAKWLGSHLSLPISTFLVILLWFVWYFVASGVWSHFMTRGNFLWLINYDTC